MGLFRVATRLLRKANLFRGRLHNAAVSSALSPAFDPKLASSASAARARRTGRVAVTGLALATKSPTAMAVTAATVVGAAGATVATKKKGYW